MSDWNGNNQDENIVCRAEVIVLNPTEKNKAAGLLQNEFDKILGPCR